MAVSRERKDGVRQRLCTVYLDEAVWEYLTWLAGGRKEKAGQSSTAPVRGAGPAANRIVRQAMEGDFGFQAFLGSGRAVEDGIPEV